MSNQVTNVQQMVMELTEINRGSTKGSINNNKHEIINTKEN